jgi:hypothetical protein
MNDADANFEDRLPEDKDMFALRWIARYLSVSINHVNNLVDSGAIKVALDVGNAGSTKAMRRVHRADLVAFLNARKNQ